uniref:DUF38 domain-containing protein n=1 Tax=Panagrolaimus sp. PS1159 TaxID=55785 RepID=A0AC35FEQ5_9BILA
MTFDEFKVLSACGTLEYVIFNNSTVTDKSDESISLENLLLCLPNVTYISFDIIVPSVIAIEDVRNVTVSELKLFEASHVSETFNFQTFIEFMKTHPFVQCRLTYEQVLSVEYMQQLENYIDKIIYENSVEFPPPVIHFPGQTSQNALEELHQRYGREQELNFL